MATTTKKNTEWTDEEIVEKVRSGEWLLSASIGMGRDSVSFCPELKRRGLVPDQVIFADTGNEKRATYRYRDEVLKPWLAANGFPELTEVRYWDYSKHGRYNTILENCIANETLPSLAFGGSCAHSTKYKHAVMDMYRTKIWKAGMDCVARGGKIVCAIGYDNSDKDLKRRRRMDKAIPNARGAIAKLQAELDAETDPKKAKKIEAKVKQKKKFIEHAEDGPFVFWYPLQTWKWDRERLTREIERAGLPVPPKSSCVICPAMKGPEIDWVAIHENDQFLQALEVERKYRSTMDIAEDGKSGVRRRDGKQVKVMGLWGQSGREVDGVRYRSWGEYAQKRGLLNADGLKRLAESGLYNSYPDVETDSCFCACGY